ncbi:hypothetical protein Q8A67_018249 [Cirrhinus molitorella]|uniref:Uncharacterized protein n=1 Tax=Cirrhinus molitorella TaxID=172907 RepID=A0AA88P8T5_9TELE|nr:hypothetical protein Q8A67_018249 [Cirrhinus molitorella]
MPPLSSSQATHEAAFIKNPSVSSHTRLNTPPSRSPPFMASLSLSLPPIFPPILPSSPPISFLARLPFEASLECWGRFYHLSTPLYLCFHYHAASHRSQSESWYRGKGAFLLTDKRGGPSQVGFCPTEAPGVGHLGGGVAGVHLRCQIHQSFIYTSIGGGPTDLQPQGIVLGAGGHQHQKPAGAEMFRDRRGRVPWADQTLREKKRARLRVENRSEGRVENTERERTREHRETRGHKDIEGHCLWSPGQRSDAAEEQKDTGVRVRASGADEVVSRDDAVAVEWETELYRVISSLAWCVMVVLVPLCPLSAALRAQLLGHAASICLQQWEATHHQHSQSITPRVKSKLSSSTHALRA